MSRACLRQNDRTLRLKNNCEESALVQRPPTFARKETLDNIGKAGREDEGGNVKG
jgi:hypothetical protein